WEHLYPKCAAEEARGTFSRLSAVSMASLADWETIKSTSANSGNELEVPLPERTRRRSSAASSTSDSADEKLTPASSSSGGSLSINPNSKPTSTTGERHPSTVPEEGSRDSTGSNSPIQKASSVASGYTGETSASVPASSRVQSLSTASTGTLSSL